MFVPVYNSLEGLSLTPKQWQNTGVTHFSFDVLRLLQRPGYPEKFDIKKDMGCPGKVILDTRTLSLNTKGEINYRSPNGALKTLSVPDLMDWLSHLGADEILADPRFYSPNFTIISKATNVISNQASEDAFMGRVYENQEVFSVLEPENAMDFRALALNCDCESCAQGVTRSYIHHLLPHTPLLAQRYLVIHNVRQMVLMSDLS